MRAAAVARADSLAGPFAAKGRLRLRGLPVDFTAAIGAMAEDAPVPVDLALRLEDSAAALGFEGALHLAAPPRAEGRLVASGPNLGRALAGLTGAPEEAPSRLLAQPFRAETGMTAGSGVAELREVRLTLGDLRAQGTARARFGEVTDIKARLAFAAIDLDALLRALPEAGARAQAGAEIGAAQAQGGTAARMEPFAFVPPPDLRLALSARAPAIKYRGGVIQDIEILASLAGQTATLSRASARLPGGSMLSLAGAATLASAPEPDAAEPLFQGIAEFSSDSLRGFLGWAGLDVGAVPPDRLTRLDFVSRIEAGSGRIALTGIDARLDAAHLSGDVAYRPAQPRPLLALDLALDRLNADAYLATGPEAAAPVVQPATPAGPRKEEGGGALAMLAALDGRFALRIGMLSVNAMPLREVSARGELKAGWLRLDPLLVDDAVGARITLRGEIGHLADAQGPLLDLRARLRHDSLSGFARAFSLPLAPLPTGGGVEIDVTARGTPRALNVAAEAALGGGRLSASGTVSGATEPRHYEMALRAAAEDGAGFLRALGLDMPAGPSAPFAAALTLAGTARALRLAPLAVSLGPMRIEGEGALTLAEPRPALTLDVAGSALDLDALLGPGTADETDGEGVTRPAGAAPWAHAPLDLSALALLDADIRARADRVTWRGWRFGEPTLTLTLRDGTLALSDATARLFDGALALEGSVRGGTDGGTGRVPALEARLRLEEADAAQTAATLAGQPFLTGRLDAAAEIAARGASPYGLVSDLRGAMEFAAEDGVLRGLDLPRLSAQLGELGSREGLAGLIAASLAGGETPYRRISGTARIRDGVLRTTDMRAEIAAAEATLRAQVDLPRYRLDALGRFRLTEYPDAPAIGVAFVGPLDAPERRIESEELRRYAAAHLLRAGIDRVIEDRLSGTGSQDGADAPEKGRQILRDLGGDLLRGLGGR
jgi:hypothetical protein